MPRQVPGAATRVARTKSAVSGAAATPGKNKLDLSRTVSPLQANVHGVARAGPGDDRLWSSLRGRRRAAITAGGTLVGGEVGVRWWGAAVDLGEQTGRVQLVLHGARAGRGGRVRRDGREAGGRAVEESGGRRAPGGRHRRRLREHGEGGAVGGGAVQRELPRVRLEEGDVAAVQVRMRGVAVQPVEVGVGGTGRARVHRVVGRRLREPRGRRHGRRRHQLAGGRVECGRGVVRGDVVVVLAGHVGQRPDSRFGHAVRRWRPWRQFDRRVVQHVRVLRLFVEVFGRVGCAVRPRVAPVAAGARVGTRRPTHQVQPVVRTLAVLARRCP